MIKKTITYEDYVNTLFNTTKKIVEFNKFKSSSHNVLTISMKKLCLDNTDDKKVKLDQINTLAIGHFKTKNKNSSF